MQSAPSFGFWRAWGLVVGNIVGAGVFLMPSVLAPYGGLGILAVAAAGLGGIAIAFTLADLSRKVTNIGGPYAYTRAAFGDFAGFLTAWVYWAALWAGAGAIASALPGYLPALFPALAGHTTLTLLITLAFIWIAVAINARGIKEAGIVGLIITIIKLGPLVAIAVGGLWWVDWQLLPGLHPTSGSLLGLFGAAFTVAFFSYVGLESATIPTDDVIDGRKTIPRATVIGTLTATLLYVLICVVVMGVLPPSELLKSSSPLAEVASRATGQVGARLVAASAVLSMYASIHYTILLGAQIPLAASRDAMFPKPFRSLSSHGTPITGLVVTGALASGLLLMNSSKSFLSAFLFINLMATLTTVVPYALCAMAALAIPNTNTQDSSSRTRSIAYAWIAFVVSFIATAGAGSDAVYWFTLLLLAGVPLYVWAKRHGVTSP